MRSCQDQVTFSSIALPMDHQPVVRQNANFTPSVWDDYFIGFSTLQAKFEPNVERMEQLKREVKAMLKSDDFADLGKTLSLIDDLQRLGISYHFEEEIDASLTHLRDDVLKENDDHNISIVALRFRLLRQQGYYVSPDVFAKFKDEEGNFKEELTKDAKGLLHLYQACWLGIHGEAILDEALDFSKGHMKRLLMDQSACNGVILAQMKRALKIPFYRGMRRLEARHHIRNYDDEIKENGHVLMELAKMDFNLLQSLHQAEIKAASIWWQESGIVQKLGGFARDRLAECYFWMLGVNFEPQYSQARMLLTKILVFMSISDDIFDAHGTIEELQLLNTTIQRWDLHNTNHLPDYMRLYIDSLIMLFKEIEENLTINGRLHRMHYLIEAYKRLVGAYIEEAKWASRGYIPTFEEYLHVSVMSSVYPLLIIAAFILMGGEEATNDVLDWVSSTPKIIKASAQVTRIMNDLVSTKFEQQRIHVASSLQCYMDDHGVNEQVATEKLNKMISDAWKDINEECLVPSQRHLKMLTLDYTRMIEVVYKYEDAYTHPSGEMKDNIAALLVHPIQD